jgi:hypothetical protein
MPRSFSEPGLPGVVACEAENDWRDADLGGSMAALDGCCVVGVEMDKFSIGGRTEGLDGVKEFRL